jgi:hypothetical protein
LPGLRDDNPGRLDQVVPIVDRASQPSSTPAAGGIVLALGSVRLGPGPSGAQRPPGVGQDPLGVGGDGVGQIGRLAGDPTHRCQGLVGAGGAIRQNRRQVIESLTSRHRLS